MAVEGIERLVEFRSVLEQSSTAERVADVLRGHIIEGGMTPGTRLSEETIGAALGVSRNTLREAFRLLGHERLLVHEFNRGVFVAKPTVRDVTDLYRIRRAVELTALRGAGDATEGAVSLVGTAVQEEQNAANSGDWGAVGTANMRFHQAIAGLAASPRTDEIVSRVLAELRLVFHVMTTPRAFHTPYLEQNREIYRLLRGGAPDEAALVLADYLDTAEQQLVAAFTASDR